MLLTDPEGNFVWKPSLKQERFLQVPLSVKEALYGGALMAGKSDVLLMYPLVHGWHEHPEFKGLFLRRTMPELKKEIIPRAESYFKPFGAKYNKTDSVFTFPSGALYFLGHCEHEKDVHNYDSMQPNYVGFDELTSFTEKIYTYILLERIRVPEHLAGVLPMIARAATNPGNIGHQFVYKRFIKRAPQGNVILKDKGGIKRIFIPATIDDNPYASKQFKDELDNLPEAERKAKKLGDWNAYEGSVFDEFRDEPYAGEPANACHYVTEFEIPRHWTRIVAIDWGFAALTSIGFGAISPSGRLYVYRHLTYRRVKIEEWAPEVKFFIEKDAPEDIVICHSAGQNRGQPQTILEQVSEALGISIRLGGKDRVADKMLVHEYLRWQPKAIIQSVEEVPFNKEYASWLYRNASEADYIKYISKYQPQNEETNLPKLQLFNNEGCKLIGEALKACVYEKDTSEGKKVEDVAEFDGDDPYDMLRMLLNACDRYLGESANKQREIERKDEVVNKLVETGDMTAFYRNMRQLESQSFNISKPVPRYGRRKGYYSVKNY